jgi:hypothetical protein
MKVFSILDQDDNKPEDRFLPLINVTLGKTTRVKIEKVTMRNGGTYEG